MIDLNEVEAAARKPWYCRSKLEDNLLSPEILVELITSLREAEKDAARYKYLKSDHKTKNLYSYQQDMKDRYWDEDIDSEIDQAMKEKGDE